jgi:predicted O-methyltransferase YrrM
MFTRWCLFVALALLAAVSLSLWRHCIALDSALQLQSASCNSSSNSSDNGVAESSRDLLLRNALLRSQLAAALESLQDAVPESRARVLAAWPHVFRNGTERLRAAAALAGDEFESLVLASLHGAALAEATAAGHALDGFIRGNRRRAHAAIVGAPTVQTVCEVGFNFGFSAAVWLMARVDVRVLSFDLLEAHAPWKRHSLARLHALFGPERLRVIAGDSADTVHVFAASQRGNVTCDVVHVDGDHRGDAPLRDLQSLRRLSHAGTVVLVDDVGTCGYCRDPQRAWDAAKAQRLVHELRCFETTIDAGDVPLSSVDAGHRFCVGSVLPQEAEVIRQR